MVVLGAVLDVRAIELRPQHIAAGGGGGEVASEKQRKGGEANKPAEANMPRCAGRIAMRHVDPSAVLVVDGVHEIGEREKKQPAGHAKQS